MYTPNSNKKEGILNVTFNPSDAKDVIVKAIDSQINACNLQRLSNWIGNNELNQDSLDNKIEQLERQKQKLMKTVGKAQTKGCNVTLLSDFKLSLD